MNRPDIDRARAVVAEQLVDECRLTRDVEARRDDTLNPATLGLTRPTGDSATIYSGPCLITSKRTQNRPGVEGGAGTFETQWRARLPVDTDVARGDVLTVTASDEQPGIVGRVFTVDSDPQGRTSTLVALIEAGPAPRR